MQIKAKAKYVRMSPRKVRLVADAARGFDLVDAFSRLALLNKKAVRPIEKLLKSALASAEHNNELKKENLFIKEIRVDDGPTYHRWKPRAYGRATPIRKRTSMISIILEEKEPSKKPMAKKKEKIETVQLDKKVSDAGEIKAPIGTQKAAAKDIEDDKKAETFEVASRKGGHRDMQQQERKVTKKKGLFKKMFRRKSM